MPLNHFNMRVLLRILFIALFQFTAAACIWDAESLSVEKSRSHDLAQTILNPAPDQADTNKLQERIRDLGANRQENDPNWWNNLAGAYLRLNQPDQAVKLLEPVAGRFPSDYGIHANLGTAYHLLGRYEDAEKEIARDLEINPDAHFGLEKYHLALLQYLVRDPSYRARHLYVDEFTSSFLENIGTGRMLEASDRSEVLRDLAIQENSNNVASLESNYAALPKTHDHESELTEILRTLSVMDSPLPYRTNWNLATDTNLVAGVIYMAQMNPKEPACITMLGMVAWKQGDYHLATNAFQKAINLGSPQAEILKLKNIDLNDYIQTSLGQRHAMFIGLALSAIAVVLFFFVLSWFVKILITPLKPPAERTQ